ncbi:hypothetical protein [Vibrio sp. B1Z05]|uniref:hypothetical protein n=1 Tax=Vibrio sp. B1Z05 TaxID=2654980 RepID=UPI00128D7454|nr:hypothetical protein [Vibrio sp. B1Z05]MPW37643.1 hypothetical protein [Vibrio sp. B1Z05]
MSKLKIIASEDFMHFSGSYMLGEFKMSVPGKILQEKIKVSEVKTVEEASEESVISIGGAAGWGVAGSVLLGPVGLLAGLILGGKSKDTTFVCEFKDGRKFIATGRTKVFEDIKKKVLAASF